MPSTLSHPPIMSFACPIFSSRFSLLSSRAKRGIAISLTTLALIPATFAAPSGWRHDGTGCFPAATPPTTWSAEQNVVWKTKLPAWSNSSIALHGDRLFTSAEPTTLLCIDKQNGTILWQRANSYADIAPADQRASIAKKMSDAKALQDAVRQMQRELKKVEKESKKAPADAALLAKKEQATRQLQSAREELESLQAYTMPGAHGANGLSSATPACDGRHVYAYFGNGVVTCYDLDGNRTWARLLEKPTRGWGHSASPLVVGQTLIVHVNKVYALDAATGETRWTAAASAQWGSPVHISVDGADAIVTAGCDVLSVADGTVLAKPAAKLTYASPSVHDGVAYFVEHGGKALRLPIPGNATSEPELLWKTEPPKGRYYGSALLHEGILYAINQRQVLSAIDAANGAVLYSEPLKLGGVAYPSLAQAGAYLYAGSDNGTTAVFEPGRAYKEVARNTLEKYRCCPVFEGKRMYVRAFEHLYCIGE